MQEKGQLKTQFKRDIIIALHYVIFTCRFTFGSLCLTTEPTETIANHSEWKHGIGI